MFYRSLRSFNMLGRLRLFSTQSLLPWHGPRNCSLLQIRTRVLQETHRHRTLVFAPHQVTSRSFLIMNTLSRQHRPTTELMIRRPRSHLRSLGGSDGLLNQLKPRRLPQRRRSKRKRSCVYIHRLKLRPYANWSSRIPQSQLPGPSLHLSSRS